MKMNRKERVRYGELFEEMNRLGIGNRALRTALKALNRFGGDHALFPCWCSDAWIASQDSYQCAYFNKYTHDVYCLFARTTIAETTMEE